MFYGNLVYFVAIWYILWPFGIFCGHLVIKLPFVSILLHEKSGKPDQKDGQNAPRTGLPDFSLYQITTKLPCGHKIHYINGNKI
jgi:hypothetical protein